MELSSKTQPGGQVGDTFLNEEIIKVHPNGQYGWGEKIEWDVQVVGSLPASPRVKTVYQIVQSNGRLLTVVVNADGSQTTNRPISEYAQLRNATETNVNAFTDWTTVPMGITDYTVGQLAVSGDGIQCQFSGVIKVTAHLSMFGNETLRTNPIIRLAGPAATPQIVQGKSGYIRDCLLYTSPSPRDS